MKRISLRKVKMKKFQLILFVAIFGLLFASCKTDISEVIVSSNPTSPGQVNATTVTFDVNHADSSMTFSWAAADFGFQSSTTYILQMSLMQDFSANVAKLLTTQNLTGKVKVSDLNTLILSWNIPIGTALQQLSAPKLILYFQMPARWI